MTMPIDGFFIGHAIREIVWDTCGGQQLENIQEEDAYIGGAPKHERGEKTGEARI